MAMETTLVLTEMAVPDVSIVKQLIDSTVVVNNGQRKGN